MLTLRVTPSASSRTWHLTPPSKFRRFPRVILGEIPLSLGSIHSFEAILQLRGDELATPEDRGTISSHALRKKRALTCRSLPPTSHRRITDLIATSRESRCDSHICSCPLTLCLKMRKPQLQLHPVVSIIKNFGLQQVHTHRPWAHQTWAPLTLPNAPPAY